MRVLILIPLLLVASSCSTPPKPPAVDAAQKRPANSAVAIDLQTCRSDLHNAALELDEKARLADSARALALKLASARQAERSSPAEDMRNVVHTVLFAFRSSRLELPSGISGQLLRDARGAPLIVLNARTDGTEATHAEVRIARERAEAVRNWLVSAGIPAARIRATWQPVGDHAAENSSPGGRALNRRVEIEVYRVAPRPAVLDRLRTDD